MQPSIRGFPTFRKWATTPLLRALSTSGSTTNRSSCLHPAWIRSTATPKVGGGAGTAIDCQMYPTGESYYVDLTTHATPYDDITNFSGGTLESAMKSGGKRSASSRV